MRSFAACFTGELSKLLVRKKYIVLAVFATIIALGTTGILRLINKVVFSAAEGAALTANMNMLFLPMLASVILPLIAMMAVCDLFATEYHTMTIKMQLTRPVTRFKIYIAKLAAPFALCLITAAVMFAVLALCGVIGGSTDGLGYAAAAYALDMIPLAVLIMMSAFVNVSVKNPVSSMFLCLVIYIGAKIFGYFSSVGSSLLFTSYTEWHRLWIGSALPAGALVAKASLILGYGLTFFCGGYLLFIKSEF